MRKINIYLVVISINIFGPLCQAMPITIDFDSTDTSINSTYRTHGFFMEDGFEIRRGSGYALPYPPLGPFDSQFILGGTRSIFNTVNQFFIRQESGGAFTLKSFDVGTVFGSGWDLRIIGWNSSNYVGEDNYIDIPTAFTTLNSNFLNGLQVDRLLFGLTGSLHDDSGFAGIDNIVLETVEVPEPSSILLLTFGMLRLFFPRNSLTNQASRTR